MTENLGTTKINDIVQTSELTENDAVVETILKELEGDDDDEDDLNLNSNDIYYPGTEDDNDNNNNDFINNDFNNHITNNDPNIEKQMLQDNNMINEDKSVMNDIMPDFLNSGTNTDVSDMFNFGELGNSCLNTIKYGIIVFLIVMLINNQLVIKHLSSIKLFIEDDKLNTYSYILQASLCAVIFIIIYHLMNNL